MSLIVGSLLCLRKTTKIYGLGSVVVGDKEYPYVQLGGIYVTCINLDFLPSTIQLAPSGVPTTPSAWYYNNDETTYGWTGKKYGLLYNKYAIPEINELLTDGWRVLTYADIYNNWWGMYSNKIGGNGNKYKMQDIPDWNGTNEMGLSIVPSGHRSTDGKFYGIEEEGRIWAYETPDSHFTMKRNASNGFYTSNKTRGLSLRLAKTP